MTKYEKIDELEVGYDIPAHIGMAYEDIQTPCLILDLDALERNVKKMGDYARAHNMRHRAHGKMHKSVDVLAGIGVGLIPDYLTGEESELVPVLEDTQLPTVPVYFVYPEELKSAKKIQVFRDFMIAKARQWKF